MVLHLGKLVRIQLAGLEQDPIRHADLADVVQRGRFEQQIDGLGSQLGTKAGVLAEGLRQQPYIVLGAQDMVAGLVVAGFGKRGEGGW